MALWGDFDFFLALCFDFFDFFGDDFVVFEGDFTGGSSSSSSPFLVSSNLSVLSLKLKSHLLTHLILPEEADEALLLGVLVVFFSSERDINA